MPEDTSYRVHSVSVVVTAEFHNPSILNRDFLVSNGIVPKDWEVVEAITTPPVSIVRYSNGIQWNVDQSRLTIDENCGAPFQNEYQVHRLAVAYLDTLPHVPYRSLGLNCVVSIKQDNPTQWLTQRFLRSGPWVEWEAKALNMVPKFTLNTHDAVCHLSFSAGQTTPPQGKPEAAVIATANLHHAGPLDVNGLKTAIAQWSRHQSLVISALDKLLKRPQA